MVSKYLGEPLFEGFAVRKSDCCLIQKNALGYRKVVFDRYVSFDRNELALEITPTYAVRYNILHKWIEKYSVRTLKDQRGDGSVSFTGDMLGRTECFYFPLSGKDFYKDSQLLKREVFRNAEYVFSQFGTLKKFYENHVQLHIANKCKFFSQDIDWGIEMLIATRLIAPEDYEKNKQVIMNRFEEINALKDPNIEFYYDRLPEIIADMEQTEFKV